MNSHLKGVMVRIIMKLINYREMKDGRRNINLTGEDGFIRNEVYNSYPYAITVHTDKKGSLEANIWFATGTPNVNKAKRIGFANLPIRRIKKHLIASRRELGLSIYDIEFVIGQLDGWRTFAAEIEN